MPIFVQGQKPDATVTAAVTDGIRLLLLVGDAMDKPQFSTTFEYLLRLLTIDLPAHAVFYYIVPQLIKMQADLGGILTIRGIRIKVVGMPARTVTHREILDFIENLAHFLIGQYATCILDSDFYRQYPQALLFNVLPCRH